MLKMENVHNLLDHDPGVGKRVFIVPFEMSFKEACEMLKFDTDRIPLVGLDTESYCIANFERDLYGRGKYGNFTYTHRHEARNMQLNAIENLYQGRALLLQAASAHGNVFIFRIHAEKEIPNCVKTFLEDESVMKIGVGIENEADALKKWKVKLKGKVELGSFLALSEKLMEYAVCGLKKMAGQIFGKEWLPYGTSRETSWSNWGQNQLTQLQILYAAFDAQIAIDIFEVFRQDFLTMKNSTGTNLNSERVPSFSSLKRLRKHFGIRKTTLIKIGLDAAHKKRGKKRKRSPSKSPIRNAQQKYFKMTRFGDRVVGEVVRYRMRQKKWWQGYGKKWTRPMKVVESLGKWDVKLENGAIVPRRRCQVNADYIEEEIKISSYPLSGALTCAKVCHVFEEVWNVL